MKPKNWKLISSEQDILSIIEKSAETPQIIFLRCKDNYVSLNKKRWKYLKEKI